MILLEINVEPGEMLILALSLFGGVIVWLLAKLLDTNKKITEHEVKIEDLQDDMKEVKRWYYNDKNN